MSTTERTDDRLILDNPPIRVKRCRRGPMMYLSTDKYMGRSLDLYGESSELEFELFAQCLKPGMVVVDVGAHIGTHTVFFAQAVGPQGAVVSVEPQRFIHQILCANIALNALQNVLTYQAAFGEEPGSIAVLPLNYGVENNFGGLELGKGHKGYSVPVMTLDSLALPQCHFVKIDVEGMEANVLRGARATLGRHRPLLYVENDRQDKSAALIALLFELDYRLFWDLRPMFNPANFTGVRENIFPDMMAFNMFGIPRSSNFSLTGFREITSPTESYAKA